MFLNIIYRFLNRFPRVHIVCLLVWIVHLLYRSNLLWAFPAVPFYQKIEDKICYCRLWLIIQTAVARGGWRLSASSAAACCLQYQTRPSPDPRRRKPLSWLRFSDASHFLFMHNIPAVNCLPYAANGLGAFCPCGYAPAPRIFSTNLFPFCFSHFSPSI